jgi:hypothetical protein
MTSNGFHAARLNAEPLDGLVFRLTPTSYMGSMGHPQGLHPILAGEIRFEDSTSAADST